MLMAIMPLMRLQHHHCGFTFGLTKGDILHEHDCCKCALSANRSEFGSHLNQLH